MSNVYNVKSAPYNALGNGTHDDTAAINSALADATAAGGGVVFFPVGTYKTSAALLITGDDVILAGSGWSSIIQPVSGATFNVISTPIPVSAGLSGYTHSYIGIEQLSIDCSNMSGTTTGRGNAIHLYGARYSYVRDVFVLSCPNWAILSDGDNTGPGNNFGYDNVFERCVFDLCNANIWTVNSEANDIVECRFKWCGGTTAANQPAFSPQDTTGMHIRCSGGYMYIAGNILGKGGTYTTEAIRLSNNGPCRVIGNRFDQVRYQAVVCNGGNHMVAHNQFGSPSSTGSVAGVQIGSSNNTIIGNKFDTTAGAAHYTYCIAESGGPFSNNTIQGNNLVIGTTGFISLNATSTDQVDNNSGYNPVGALGPPSVPASTVSVTNNYGVDCAVFVKGGTLTDIKVGGTSTGIAAAAAANTAHAIRVAANQTISITYTVAPSWTWFGD